MKISCILFLQVLSKLTPLLQTITSKQALEIIVVSCIQPALKIILYINLIDFISL